MEERYTRQEAVIGKENQKKLSQSKVAVIGLGATGSVAAEMLARAGVGDILIVDRDGVESSNLSRQTLYTEQDIGKEKALTARERLKQINSLIKITALAVSLDSGNIESVLGKRINLIFDCTDNLETRFLLNEFCRKNNISAVFCGVAGMKGFVLPVEREFCFNCVFMYAKEALTCSGEGILGATVHLAASLQVKEGLDILLNKKGGKLILFDLEKEDIEKIKVRKNPACLVCQSQFYCLDEKEKKKSSYTIKKCKTRAAFSVRFNKKIDLSKIKKRYKVLLETPLLLVVEKDGAEMIVHQYGEVIFKKARDYSQIEKLAEEIYFLGYS
ncbi:MAG TPA: HesA/MoeB/ThiF family protein [Candidatus Nanoarchaeia archaeon]|nr:HesA/MoeB/ThiF family protein [Candidatus Nanoarchaeia archaeon]